ncbi:hypothetical protein LK07_01890 [Streptomyces pluripotens]|uniref:Uncharacterized protein n=1 Tax=Streptomyces pluripotens TaxID=1355015 RepID=A0A221NTV7_9ACTN|nr:MULTISPECIES: hypothetical protein [Streptomyces]ARP68719.1 hypothetical protein LK06_000805 [Streptomyces pluripotens]ASN22975.1 hypothetical protein LK07_01890 [Streptomyces pluripotens]MCH0558553.1 hypothetical protein [Streptomyces sp. MUM 16J]
MSNSVTGRAGIPQTLWAAHGRHTGPAPDDLVRQTLRRHKESGDIDDFAEPPVPEDSTRRIFEARWRADGTVTVRARLTLGPCADRPRGHQWRLIAEAEHPWDEGWASPATLFWPEDGSGEGDDSSWDHHATLAGVRFRRSNALPTDDKEMRRRLRDATRDTWYVNLVVHEAMTPDERGRLPLSRFLPPGLRDRVVEHRAAPHQLRAVNWALRDLGVEVPRGGAVVLPPSPVPEEYDSREHSVRSVFLNGSEPVELIAALRRFDALPRPLPLDAEEALADLRENWTLLTLREQLVRERRLVAMYAEALEAMTTSRDLYKEAAEQALEALQAYRDLPAPVLPQQQSGSRTPGALQQLTRTFERLKFPGKAQRPPVPAPGPSPELSPGEGPTGSPNASGEPAAHDGATFRNTDLSP